MPLAQTKVPSATATAVTVAASLMLATSTVAVLLSGGMMAAAVLFSHSPPGMAAVELPLVGCPTVPNVELGRRPNRANAARAAARLEEITRGMVGRVKGYRAHRDASGAGQLQQLAQERKRYLVETFRERADSAVVSMLPRSYRETVLGMTQNCVESERTVEGSLEVTHEDFFQDGMTWDEYRVTTPQNEYIVLHPIRGLPRALISGMRVRVKGLQVDGHLLFDGTFSLARPNGDLGGIDIIAIPRNPPVVGDQKIAVLLANFQDTLPPNVTMETVRDVMFNHVNSYVQENSYHQVSVSGDIFGWQTLPLALTCDVDAILDGAVRLFDPAVNFKNYSRLVIVSPLGDRCGWRGKGTIDKKTVNTADGAVTVSVSWLIDTHFTPAIASHELGHNFGNHHASFLFCGDVSYQTDGCLLDEYGDYYDVMGDANKNNGHFNALHKEYVGWLAPPQILPVSSNGEFTLAPIEIPTGALQALKIPRAEDDYLYVEYRQPIGYDVPLGNSGSDVFAGALLHVVAASLNWSNKSLLLDPTPPTLRFYPALAVGKTFRDPQSGATVTTVAKDAASLKVSISVVRLDFSPPEVSLTAPQAEAEVLGTIAVSASASDAAGIQKVEFYTPQMGVFAADVTPPYEAELDTRFLPNGPNYVAAIAYDTAGEESQTPANYRYSAFVPMVVANSDVLPPTVAITTPTAGSFVKSPVTVVAEASDDIGIWKVVFSADRAAWLQYHDSQAPYGGSISLSQGVQTLKATAYDFVGNTAVAEVDVLVVADATGPTVAIVQPRDGEAAGKTVFLQAAASDDLGVANVEFFMGNNILIGSDPAEPYGVRWDTTSVRNGSYRIYANAYDLVGNRSVSPAVTITVDNTAPTITLSAPADGERVSGLVALAASAWDSVGVGRVDFYRDDNVLLGTVTVSPYRLEVDTTPLSDGTHALYAKAVDTAGNAAYAEKAVVRVSNPLFLRGDANADGTVDVADPIHTLTRLFLSGPAPACHDAADANDDGSVDIADPVFTLRYLFTAEASPLPLPGTQIAGVDPTGDVLPCER